MSEIRSIGGSHGLRGGEGGHEDRIGRGGGEGEGRTEGENGQRVPPGLAKKPEGLPPGQLKKFGDGFEHEGEDGEGQVGAQGEDGNNQGQPVPSVGGTTGLSLDQLLSLVGQSTPTAPTAPKATPNPALPDITGAANGQAKPLPYINQYNPVGKDASYTNGAENCGPAILAMIAKSRGQTGGLADAQLVNQVGRTAGTTGAGTTGNGMIAGLQALGMQTAAAPGADMNFINSQLAQGHEVISNGDFYSVPTHADPNLTAGHYIAVTGVNNGVYTVVDPADPTIHSMTAQQLQSFIASHPQGGFSLGAW
jgi:peptidase C39-like protein